MARDSSRALRPRSPSADPTSVSAPAGGSGGTYSWARRRASASVPASAQTWVTGSSGSGRASAQPSSWNDLDAVDELQVAGRPAPRASASPCPSAPRASRPSRGRRGPRGRAATTSDRRWPVRASRSSTFTNAAAASKAGRNPGRMNPPWPSAAKPTPGSVAASISAGVESFVGRTRTPCGLRRAARRGVVTLTGRAIVSPSRWSHTSSMHASVDSVSVSTWPSSSMRREPLAVRVEDRAEVGARGPHQAGDPLGGGVAVEADHAGGRGVRVHGEHVGAELGEHVRHDERRRAVGVVDDHLEPVRRDRRHVDRGLEGDGVVLEGAGRELDVADLLGQDPAVVLPLEQPLDLALRVLGDVGAGGVEEAHDDALGVVGDEPDREAAGGSGRADEEPRDRHADATSRSSTSIPAALRPDIIARFSMRAGAAGVARGDDRGALAAGWCRRPSRPWRPAPGVMSTLASPLTPSRPNRLRAPLLSHTIERVDDRAVLDRLERVHLDVAAEHGVGADEHLVAEHDALVDADVGADARRPRPMTAPRSRAPGPM